MLNLLESNNSHDSNKSVWNIDNNTNQNYRENKRHRIIDGFHLLDLFNNTEASFSAIYDTTITRLSSLTVEGAELNMTLAINV